MLHIPHPPTQRTRVLDRSGVLSLIAALILLVAVAGASVWQASENSDALALAQATRAQRNNLVNILLAAQDAETGQRGYLLTADPDYLQPFTHTKEVMPQLLASLAAARPNDPQVATLAKVVTDKVAELDKTVALARGGDLPAALAVVRTNAGRTAMVEIRQMVGTLEAGLDADLVAQVGAVTRGGSRLVAIDIAGLVMVLGLTGLIALGLRTYLTGLRAAQEMTAKANETLERTNEQLDDLVRVRTEDLTAANEEIQRFAYIVSHDLRAPLVNVMGFTSELEQAAGALTRHLDTQTVPAELREAIAEDIPEALRFIRSSTSKMDRLINAILKLSREGRRVLVPEPLDMAALLHNIADSMQHQATSKQAVIEIGTVPSIISDRLAVEQIFTNVMDNALKYLKPDRPGAIKIDGRREGSMVRYDIADNGRGIAERDYERVFELFRRAGDQTVPGEGIGLAHVRALVRRLGGSIECSSALGVGTTFTVRVPAVAQIGMENMA
jgi:signal transduction histidine kinase